MIIDNFKGKGLEIMKRLAYWITMVLILFLFLSCLSTKQEGEVVAQSVSEYQSKGLRTIGEVTDGTVRDIASGDDVLYLAQGRNLALLDPNTGLRIANYNDPPYPNSLVAVEFDKVSNTLFVASNREIYIHDQTHQTLKIWKNESERSISDFKYIGQDQVLLVVLFDQVAVIDYSQDVPVIVSKFAVPKGIMFFQRIAIFETRSGQMAYLSGAISRQEIRGVNGLVIVNLDSEQGYRSPEVYSSFWNPTVHYGSSAATVRNVQVLEDYQGQYTYAFVAVGQVGQLTVLDVTDPALPTFVCRIVLAEDFEVFHVLIDDDLKRLFVVSTNILHVLSLTDLSVLSSRNIGFFNAGDRDIVLHYQGSKKQLWSATRFSVDYVINAVDVTTNRLNHIVKQWWISSSDGAVAVPQWNSVYLPTFGGIVRYDVADETNPVAVDESYQPAKGMIEHIDLVFPQTDLSQALLLTAPGNGGVQYWEVSADNPNPQPPTKVVQKPAHWGNDPVYQNDVGYFFKDGVLYFLSDLANRRTQEIALQIYNTVTGEWIDVLLQNEYIRSNSHSIAVSEEYAFVTANGGFFVVDLSSLPYYALITDVVVNDWNSDGRSDDTNAIMISADSCYIFIAHDPGVVQSYGFDAITGKVTGPLDILVGAGITGVTNRGRYFEDLDRLYIAARGGNILEIDVRDPFNLKLLSSWNNGAYQGEMQDARIYDFGNGPRVLAVKNNEAFAILEIIGMTE